MLRGQTLKTQSGLEICLLPMETLTETQTYNVGTHIDSKNMDLGGDDGGIDAMYAPATVRLFSKSSTAGHAVMYESVSPVLWKDGSIDFFTMRLVHDNDIGDLEINKVYNQGEKIYDEGTSGYATGNHIHVSVARGKYAGLRKTSAGYNTLKNEVPLEDLFFANNTVIRKTYRKWEVYKMINFTEPVGAPKALVLVDVLRYRNKPSIIGTSLGVLPKGKQFNYLGFTIADDGYRWAKMEIDGTLVYAAMEDKTTKAPWLQIIEPKTETPVDMSFAKDGLTITVKGTVGGAQK